MLWDPVRLDPPLCSTILHASAISLVRSIAISLNQFIFWRSRCFRIGCVINSSFHIATHQNTCFGWLSNHKLPCQKLKLVCCQQSHHLTYSEHFDLRRKCDMLIFVMIWQATPCNFKNVGNISFSLTGSSCINIFKAQVGSVLMYNSESFVQRQR